MFTITITKTETVRRLQPRKWEVLRKDGKGECDYGYAPAIEKDEKVTTQLFQQIFEDVDVAGVVSRLNGGS